MRSNSLKVMQIVNDLDVGGAQEVVRTLVENLSLLGCTPVVCAFRPITTRARRRIRICFIP